MSDHIKNGLYCKSGFAFKQKDDESEYAGKCATVDHVKFDGAEIEYPYQCDPRDNEKKCQFYYNITTPEGG